ncbi:MAG: YraN family protein [Prochloraceae cyanobacterium]|nr:YraN family protein [Prochloraceae cyanobacterium]
MIKIGQLGEDLIASWLKTRGWVIRYTRWYCRWGEIDLIAQCSESLRFIEVKTRRSPNWDAGGLLAINPQKQAKLSQTAAFFLSKHPELADFPCQFDVALVSYQPTKKTSKFKQSLELGKPIYWQGYQLTIQKYIEAAFDVS